MGAWLPTKIGGNNRLCRFTAHDWNHLDGSTEATPFKHPLLKKAQIIALHELEAAAKVRLDPTVNILQTFRQHTRLITQLLVDGHHIVVFEPFNDMNNIRSPIYLA